MSRPVPRRGRSNRWACRRAQATQLGLGIGNEVLAVDLGVLVVVGAALRDRWPGDGGQALGGTAYDQGRPR